MWRFRWSLTGEPRALTKVLRCVDWGDAREARAAGTLISRWAPIGLADALELLSPAFSNPEVTLQFLLGSRRGRDGLPVPMTLGGTHGGMAWPHMIFVSSWACILLHLAQPRRVDVCHRCMHQMPDEHNIRDPQGLGRSQDPSAAVTNLGSHC